MAGSYRHLVNHRNEPYRYDNGEGWALLDNMGDALECIDELFAMVQFLSGGDRIKIHEAWREGYCRFYIPRENYLDEGLTGFDAFWERDNDNDKEET